MNTQIWNLFKTVMIVLVSSGTVTAIITKYLDKHINELEAQMNEVSKVLNKNLWTFETMLKSNKDLLSVLHDSSN